MTGSRGARQTAEVVYRSTGEIDAIDQYSRRLVVELVRLGTPAQYLSHGLPFNASGRSTAPWLLIQYCPFSYGRWGVAPQLVLALAALRRRSDVRVGIVVHEAWVSNPGWRNRVMGTYQRAQLRRLVDLAHVLIVTTEELAAKIGRPALHVPVASNIAPVATTRDAARAELGYGDALVVGMFGTSHPSRAIGNGVAAIAAVAEQHRPSHLRVLNLGADAPGLDLPAEVKVETPGVLTGHELSLRLRACDMLLLPFSDGLSTRRTTLMAGLAHGVPVVGSAGSQTDGALLDRRDALVLTPLDTPGAFVEAAVALAGDPERRRAIGAAGQLLYATTFDWPILAGRVQAAMQGRSC